MRLQQVIQPRRPGAFFKRHAIMYEGHAVDAWKEIIAAAGDQYIDNMYFGSYLRGFPHHWTDELPTLESSFAELQAERASAHPTAGAEAVLPSLEGKPNPPTVSLLPSASDGASPGADFTVRAKVTAPAGVRWIRLRYRHVNQKEDYETLAMRREGTTGMYGAVFLDRLLLRSGI
jgi:hypothetical protein